MIIKILSIDDYTADDFERMSEQMSPARRVKAAGYVNSEAWKLCILADYCLKKAVEEYGKAPSGNAEIVYAPNGKPYIEGADFEINISHSGRFAAAAVSVFPVGIDIEDKRRVSLSSARKFATENELKYIGDSPERLLRIWTHKEAFLKCTGEGICNNLKDIEISPDGETLITEREGYYFSGEVSQDYVVTVCEKKI